MKRHLCLYPQILLFQHGVWCRLKIGYKSRLFSFNTDNESTVQSVVQDQSERKEQRATEKQAASSSEDDW
jgi:hypothetical protein